MFTDDQKRVLIEIARASVLAQVTGRPGSDPTRGPDWGQTPDVRLHTAGENARDRGQTPDVRLHTAGENARDRGQTPDVGLHTAETPDVRLHTAGENARVRGQTPVVELPTASGAFVTLKCDGELRGCLGTLECREPLAEEIARLARSTAHEDPRFDPVRPSELPHLRVEVSVLGPLELIDPLDPDAFVIGRHGLVVEQGRRRGLLLPQVATEWNWTRDEFLAHTCRKAGLPADAWKRGATVYRFDAVVFGED